MIDRNYIADLLTANTGGPRVSIYMPTHRSGPETRQDPIRFRNLLDEAETELTTLGYGAEEILELLQGVRPLIQDGEFWRHQRDGLAAFIAPGFLRVERLPLSPRTTCQVADRFHVRPLLPLLGRRAFYVLTLSQGGCQLFEGDDESLETLPLECENESVSSLTPDRRVDGALQYRSASSPASQRQGSAPVYHGQSPADQKEEADLQRYVREVDRCVAEALKDADGPLILAAVGYVAAAYEAVNSFRDLASRKIPGNPGEWSRDELHRLARDIASANRVDAKAKVAEEFHAARGGDLATDDTTTIVAAAIEGRVGALLLTPDSECWGDLDDLHRVTITGDEADDDLVEQAAESTLLQGGEVIVLDRDQFPSDQALAAILRYAS